LVGHAHAHTHWLTAFPCVWLYATAGGAAEGCLNAAMLHDIPASVPSPASEQTPDQSSQTKDNMEEILGGSDENPVGQDLREDTPSKLGLCGKSLEDYTFADDIDVDSPQLHHTIDVVRALLEAEVNDVSRLLYNNSVVKRLIEEKTIYKGDGRTRAELDLKHTTRATAVAH